MYVNTFNIALYCLHFYVLSQHFILLYHLTMSTPRQQPKEGPNTGEIKDEGREARLSFRRFAEHKMRREFKEAAIKKCDGHLKAFGQCAQDSGLLVVFKCRDLNKKINECMMENNSDEKFQAFLKEHEGELEKRTIRSKN